MRPTRNQPRKVRHIHHQVRANFIRNRTQPRKIEDCRGYALPPPIIIFGFTSIALRSLPAHRSQSVSVSLPHLVAEQCL